MKKNGILTVTVRSQILILKVLMRVFPETSNITQATAVVLVVTLLKKSQTFITGHKEIREAFSLLSTFHNTRRCYEGTGGKHFY